MDGKSLGGPAGVDFSLVGGLWSGLERKIFRARKRQVGSPALVDELSQVWIALAAGRYLI